MNDETKIHGAHDHEALFSAVERAGAALVAALRACVAAGIPAERLWIAEAERGGRTDAVRAWIAERDRAKGPMATVSVSGRWSGAGSAYQAEVGSITDASIILRDGSRFRRSDGYEARRTRYGDSRAHIERAEIDRIVALGWTPPKAAKKARMK